MKDGNGDVIHGECPQCGHETVEWTNETQQCKGCGWSGILVPMEKFLKKLSESPDDPKLRDSMEKCGAFWIANDEAMSLEMNVSLIYTKHISEILLPLGLSHQEVTSTTEYTNKCADVLKELIDIALDAAAKSCDSTTKVMNRYEKEYGNVLNEIEEVLGERGLMEEGL